MEEADIKEAIRQRKDKLLQLNAKKKDILIQLKTVNQSIKRIEEENLTLSELMIKQNSREVNEEHKRELINEYEEDDEDA